MEDRERSPRIVRALPGTHERVVETALRYVSPGSSAVDLGAGSGALAERLQAAGFKVTAVDIENYFELGTEFFQLDLNDPNFERALPSQFDLVTSVEVIEHLENPTAFLRSVRKLLKPEGIAILTTPNVENVAARLKFLLTGEVRAMNKNSPEHITPIYLDLFVRKIAPPSGLTLAECFTHPPNDYPLTARRYFVPLFRLLAPFMKGAALSGDCHFLVLKRTEGRRPASSG
jgi:SAM-dependent methyltransferase